MMIKNLEMGKDLCLVVLTMVVGALVGAPPAHADQVLDQQLCLLYSSGSLSLSQPAVTWGDTVGVTWSTNLSTYCAAVQPTFHIYANDVDQGTGPGGTVGSSGIIGVTPFQTTPVRLTMITSSGSRDLASVPVTVNPYDAAPLPSDMQPSVTILGDDPAWRRIFVRAVRTMGETVHIASGVNLDLSGLEYVPVASGVQIMGDRTVVATRPRIFTTSFPHTLLMIGNDCAPTTSNDCTPTTSNTVRISGIRLDGGESEDPFSAVGKDDADGIGVYSSQHVEIDHNEIDHWRGSGVNVHDGQHQINQDNASTVWVHDNYIHHNQHPSADTCFDAALGHYHAAGYGVALSTGAYALIERNVFDWNRHSVAGDGSEGTGYLFYRNLILQHGGVHFRCITPDSAWTFILSPFVQVILVETGILDDDGIYHTHAIDMHGSNPTGAGDHSGGLAGEYMDVEYNTVLYTAGNGIHLRGTPMLASTSPPDTTKVGMYVMHNVFAHQVQWADVTTHGYLTPGAMYQNETGLYPSDNIYGSNTFYDRKSCDFDGDGISDPFIATGVTWWYASSALDGQWVYLNQSPARVADVTLDDFDGDGRCDVYVGGNQVFLNTDPQPFARSPGNVSTVLGTPVSVNLAASGGALPYLWSVSGLPPGLSASAAGQIAGTPVANGTPTYAVTATVTDATHQSSTVTFTWTLVTRVPRLHSLDRDTAENLITAAGLTGGKVSSINNCAYPDDVVLTQNPAAGDTRPMGSLVDITVSTCITGGGGGGTCSQNGVTNLATLQPCR